MVLFYVFPVGERRKIPDIESRFAKRPVHPFHDRKKSSVRGSRCIFYIDSTTCGSNDKHLGKGNAHAFKPF
jgi:hypothetical protein